MQANKQFKAIIVTKSGTKFSFTWNIPMASIMHQSPEEVFLLQEEFVVKETAAGAKTHVPVSSIDHYTLKPIENMPNG